MRLRINREILEMLEESERVLSQTLEKMAHGEIAITSAKRLDSYSLTKLRMALAEIKGTEY